MEQLPLPPLPLQEDTQLPCPQHRSDNNLVRLEESVLPPDTVGDATKMCAFLTDLDQKDSDYIPSSVSFSDIASPPTSPEKIVLVSPKATKMCIDIRTEMPHNNMCFEASNDCTKTVPDYANSIGLDITPMPKRATYKMYPYNLWAATLVP